jgi:type II secretory pathway pseudopilin PulG
MKLLNEKKIKGISLIEILVVVVLVGIVGVFAIPNMKDWMTRKELKNDFFTIHKMVTGIRTEVGLGVYHMGGIFIDNNNGNGIIIKIRYRDPDKFRIYKNSCEDIDSQWDGVETISSSTNEFYAKFENIRLSANKISSCISKAGYSNFTTGFYICHKKQNPNVLCDVKTPGTQTISNKNNFYESYYLGLNRLGYDFIRRVVYKNGSLVNWENL